MPERENSPTVKELEPQQLQPDEDTTSTGDFPVRDEARRVVAAVLRRETARSA